MSRVSVVSIVILLTGLASASATGPSSQDVARLGAEWQDWAVAAVAAHGSLYLAGYTDSDQLVGDTTAFDAFVMRLDETTGEVERVARLGGASFDAAFAMAATSDGVVVGGLTYSTDFPATVGRTYTLGGGRTSDGWAAKLDVDLAPVWATYVGGSGEDAVLGLTADAQDRPILVGRTESVDLPTAHAAQDMRRGAADGFLTRLSADGTEVQLGTYLGGGFGTEIFGPLALVAPSECAGRDAAHAVGTVGTSLLVAGTTCAGPVSDFPGVGHAGTPGQESAFVLRLDESGELEHARVFHEHAGSGATSLDVDEDGTAWIAGWLSAAGGSDAFVVAMDPTDQYSDLLRLGGSSGETAAAIQVEGDRVWLTGYTYSRDFPGATTALNQGGRKSADDAYLSLLDKNLTLQYTLLVGGSSYDAGFALAASQGVAWLSGFTISEDLPVTRSSSPPQHVDILLARVAT